YKLIFFSFMSVLGISVSSQNLEPYEAEELFNKKYYTAVWKYYRDKLKEDSLNTEWNYKMGVCYLNSRSQKEKSIQYFKRAASDGDNKAIHPATTFKLLADANYITGNYDNAISYYEKYQILAKSIQSSPFEDITREIEMCKMAKELKELKEITAKLITQRNKTKKNRNTTGYEKIGYSIANASPVFISNNIGIENSVHDDKYFEEGNKVNVKNLKLLSGTLDSSKTKMETTIASSTDGQIILIYRDDNGEANLYTSVLNGNDWIEPEKLSKVVNNHSWEPDEFISPDGNTLYFASNRDGGFGGKDIYKCEKLTNGEWGKATNLGSTVNTVYDEEAPFIFPDGVTLYFSSNRNRPKGGFDNFTCSLSDTLGWTAPVNIGYPQHETVNTEGKTNNQADTSFTKDNYLSTFISHKNAPITIIKGRIANYQSGEIPPSTEITITNNETGNVAGVYRPDVKTGKYTCIVPSGKNNNVTFEAKGYLFHSENIDIPKDQGYFQLQQPVVLKPIIEGSKTVLKNVFFEKENAAFTSASRIELNKLHSLLQDNPGLLVELSGTVEKKSSAEDIDLMEAKLQSVINFLYEKGIDKARIKQKVYRNSKKKKKAKNFSLEDKKYTERLELKILAKK
ncbi:MAG: hypothetical protein ACXWCA_07090, partial [Kaistella sp.]